MQYTDSSFLKLCHADSLKGYQALFEDVRARVESGEYAGRIKVHNAPQEWSILVLCNASHIKLIGGRPDDSHGGKSGVQGKLYVNPSALRSHGINPEVTEQLMSSLEEAGFRKEGKGSEWRLAAASMQDVSIRERFLDAMKVACQGVK